MPATRRDGISRGRFIAGTAGAAGVIAVGAIGGTQLLSGKGGSSLQDATPLALALALEKLQAAFYAEAVSAGALDGELLEFATTVRDHEAQHVDLEPPAGDRGVRRAATYDFGGDTTDPDAFGTTAAQARGPGGLRLQRPHPAASPSAGLAVTEPHRLGRRPARGLGPGHPGPRPRRGGHRHRR